MKDETIPIPNSIFILYSRDKANHTDTQTPGTLLIASKPKQKNCEDFHNIISTLLLFYLCRQNGNVTFLPS